MDNQRKEYLRQWWKDNQDKRRMYEKRYKTKHPERIKEKEARRRKKPEHIAYMKEYKKSYIQRPEVRYKHRIRVRSNEKYGKTPVGYQKHHLSYDTPDNFIIVPIETHIQIHKCKTEDGTASMKEE